MTQAQQRRLAALANAATARRKHQAAAEKAEQRMRAHIVKAFAEGIPRPVIAEAAGLSLPRVYQIRDGRR